MFVGGGAIREGYRVKTWPKNPIMAPFSEYLSADMSADALGIINIGQQVTKEFSLEVVNWAQAT